MFRQNTVHRSDIKPEILGSLMAQQMKHKHFEIFSGQIPLAYGNKFFAPLRAYDHSLGISKGSFSTHSIHRLGVMTNPRKYMQTDAIPSKLDHQ